MDAFPAYFPLHGATIIIAGYGEGADAKARLFDNSPARIVRLVEPQASDPAAYADAALAFIAHEDEAFCVGAAAAARAAGVPVNVVDRPALCDFTTPALIDRGQVVAAIGTGGSAPLLASLLRADIEARIPQGVGQVAQLLKDMQSEIRAAFPDLVRRRAFMRLALSEDLGVDMDAAKQRLRQLLAKGLDLRGRAYQLDGQGPAQLLSLMAAKILSEADILVTGTGSDPDIAVLARRDAQRLAAQGTSAKALLDLIAQGLCVVLVGAPVLAKAVQDLGQTIELLPIARQP